ncbi:hypothetical protein [Mesobacillus thioparans]|uniref:hypothetical protein n=1 Tax=Mesobacillus thioparans TaxID=370439 RepID=UPI0039F002D3
MYRKNCDRCNRPSYSSSEQGEWLCPVCRNDLTRYPFFNAISLEKVVIKHRWKTAVYSQTQQPKGPASDLWG